MKHTLTTKPESVSYLNCRDTLQVKKIDFAANFQQKSFVDRQLRNLHISMLVFYNYKNGNILQ